MPNPDVGDASIVGEPKKTFREYADIAIAERYQHESAVPDPELDEYKEAVADIVRDVLDQMDRAEDLEELIKINLRREADGKVARLNLKEFAQKTIREYVEERLIGLWNRYRTMMSDALGLGYTNPNAGGMPTDTKPDDASRDFPPAAADAFEGPEVLPDYLTEDDYADSGPRLNFLKPKSERSRPDPNRVSGKTVVKAGAAIVAAIALALGIMVVTMPAPERPSPTPVKKKADNPALKKDATSGRSMKP